MTCTTYPEVTTALAKEWRTTAFAIREEHAHNFEPCRSQTPCIVCYLATAVVALVNAREGRLKIAGAPGFVFKLSDAESQRMEDELRAYARKREGME